MVCNKTKIRAAPNMSLEAEPLTYMRLLGGRIILQDLSPIFADDEIRTR